MSDISSLTLYNRTDGSQSRLKDFYVLISESAFDPSASLNDHLGNGTITQEFFSGAAGAQVSIPLTASGRFVRIQLSGNGILHMAEVEVWGCPSDSDPCVGADPVEIVAAGPFVEDAGLQQLQASPAGGAWSGAVSGTGVFDPSQGPGSYTVSYTFTNGAGCTQTDSKEIVVNPVGGCTSTTNVALNKPASQSSTYGAAWQTWQRMATQVFFSLERGPTAYKQ